MATIGAGSLPDNFVPMAPKPAPKRAKPRAKTLKKARAPRKGK